jgi:hypothetical protein
MAASHTLSILSHDVLSPPFGDDTLKLVKVVEQGKEGEAFLFGTFKGIWEGLSMKDLTTYKVCDSLRVQHNKDGTTTKLTLGMVKALVPQADQEKMVEVRRNFFWCVPCCVGFCVILLPEKNLLPLFSPYYFICRRGSSPSSSSPRATLCCAKWMPSLSPTWPGGGLTNREINREINYIILGAAGNYLIINLTSQPIVLFAGSSSRGGMRPRPRPPSPGSRRTSSSSLRETRRHWHKTPPVSYYY